jgi:hypothetical protein
MGCPLCSQTRDGSDDLRQSGVEGDEGAFDSSF